MHIACTGGKGVGGIGANGGDTDKQQCGESDKTTTACNDVEHTTEESCSEQK